MLTRISPGSGYRTGRRSGSHNRVRHPESPQLQALRGVRASRLPLVQRELARCAHAPVALRQVTPRKDMERIVKAAEERGWRVAKTRRGHWMLYSPDGVHIVTAAGTPGSASSVRKTLAILKRYGFEQNGR